MLFSNCVESFITCFVEVVSSSEFAFIAILSAIIALVAGAERLVNEDVDAAFDVLSVLIVETRRSVLAAD